MRRLTLFLAPLITLALFGCDRPSGALNMPGFAADVAEEPFIIGVPDKFKTPGVYGEFALSHGVYIVSDDVMLTALAAQCTNEERCDNIAVRYDDTAGVFRCPHCATTYTSFGLPQRRTQPPTDRMTQERANQLTTGSDRALQRCQIRHHGPLLDPSTELQVRPGARFIHEEQEWSKPLSMYVWDAKLAR